MSYNENRNEYVMEYMNYTLDSYITKNNPNLSTQQRKGIIQQILKAFSYIYSIYIHLHKNPLQLTLTYMLFEYLYF